VLYAEMGLISTGKKTAITKQLSTGRRPPGAGPAGHEIADLILKFRESAKLKGTYLDPLPPWPMPADGPHHLQADRTATAAFRPSIQPPEHPDPFRHGAEVRKAFAAPEGKRLVVGDYSQIELRLLAHSAGMTT